MVREIIVDWTTQNGSGKASVFYFIEGTPVADQRLSLSACLANIDGGLDNSTVWTIRTTGRELDTATGALTGAWTEATSRTGTGGVSGEPVPDAVQVLFQWHTGEIVNGRFLRGRTFIPGLAAANVVNGNLSAGIVTLFEGYGDTLIATADQLAVWHRPVAGAGGSAEAVSDCTVWPELAVLRRRRG
jgi:hypothetical protein